MPTEYQIEQLETLVLTRRHLKGLSVRNREGLRNLMVPYLNFRRDTAAFLSAHFGGVCFRKCYENRESACCGKDAIIVYFADVLVNALTADDSLLDDMEDRLRSPNATSRCVFLREDGCRWHVKPIVCEMFVCDGAKAEALGTAPRLEAEWAALEERRREFTWPDRPVLFDDLERRFIEAGLDSPLMHFHRSPGLLRMKREALKRRRVNSTPSALEVKQGGYRQ